MAISEADRHRLFSTLERVLGPEDAATLMESLPPVDWTQLATKDDIAELRRELHGVRQATKDDIAELRTELHGVRDELRTEMHGVRDELRSELHGIRDELRYEMRSTETRLVDHIDLRVDARLANSMRSLLFSVLALNTAMAGAVIAAVRLG